MLPPPLQPQLVLAESVGCQIRAGGLTQPYDEMFCQC